jgi:hypothetical protein
MTPLWFMPGVSYLLVKPRLPQLKLSFSKLTLTSSQQAPSTQNSKLRSPLKTTFFVLCLHITKVVLGLRTSIYTVPTFGPSPTTSTSYPSRVRGGVHYSVKIQDPLRAPVGCYNSICLDPETVRYLDYNSDRACSTGIGSYATRD